MQHLAAKPVSLFRGVVLEENVVIRPNEEDPYGGSRESPTFNHIPVFKSKLSLDSNSDSIGSSTIATEYSSDVSSVGDQDSSLHGSLAFSEPHQEEFASMSDEELLLGIEDAISKDKIVLVSRFLCEMGKRQLQLKDRKRHATLLENARMIEEVIVEHEASPEAGGWKINCIMHGKHGDTIVYYKLNEKQEITIRYEMAMEESLLVPLVSVLNETDHYTSWLPSFQRPFRLGLRKTEKLQQIGRALQIARARMDMPWPMRNREIVAFNIVAEAVDEIGAVVVKVKSLDAGEHNGCMIPPCPPGWERVSMDGGLMIRKFPKDHPALKKRHKNNRKTCREPVLVSLTLGVRPSLNVVTRTVAAPMWIALLSVAEDVRDGKRPLHKQAIEEKPELYRWVAESVEKLKAKLE